jgi:hypothetical protein
MERHSGLALGTQQHLQVREGHEVRKALELAAVCKHPDSVWLTNLFARHRVSSRPETSEVFLACEGDARALCFASFLGEDEDEDEWSLRQSAEMGYAFAQALMARRTWGEEKFRWAEKSAAQRERDGFSCLARCYEEGHGCPKDVERAENDLFAIELGCVESMIHLGDSLDASDPRRFFWLGKATALGYPYSTFLAEMEKQIDNFNSGSGNANVVFTIGRALEGQIDTEMRRLFGNSALFRDHLHRSHKSSCTIVHLSIAMLQKSS